MKTPSFFQRSELTATLWSFRREFLVVGIFSMVVNLLMLTPTIYMLQVYDRFMTGRNESTLIAVSLIVLFLFAVIAFAEWSRSRLLVRLGVRLDERLNSRVFNACFESHLNQSRDNPVEAFSNLTNVRQFITGNGIFAFFDAPWSPIYLLVLFMLHPSLGVLSLIFAGILTGVAIFSHRVTQTPTQKTTEAGVKEAVYLHSKLRNAEVIESLGMLGNLRQRWLGHHQRHMSMYSASQDRQRRIQALSKFIRYSQQSLMLGAGALLVIEGELTTGGMIAANVLMSRCLQPIDTIVGSWAGWQSARKAFEALESLLRDHPERPAGLIHEALRGAVRIENLVATASNRVQPILAGLTAEFPAGEVIAIVGPSGSGKSTLARSWWVSGRKSRVEFCSMTGRSKASTGKNWGHSLATFHRMSSFSKAVSRKTSPASARLTRSRSSKPPSGRASMTWFCASRAATTRPWGKPAASFPEDNGNASVWHVRCMAIPA